MANSQVEYFIKQALAAHSVCYVESIQTLWSGYGEIARYAITGAKQTNIILKHVKLPDANHHPRGWNTDRSHQRKLKSYQVESNWYAQWAKFCDHDCRVPQCFAVKNSQDEFLMVLEDLDAAGYPARHSSVSIQQMKPCLSWLANFHGTFITDTKSASDAISNKVANDVANANSNEISNSEASLENITQQLWPIGTYWHLDTRPDELNALTDQSLKAAAGLIDAKLSNCRYHTLLHGDAKLANFCFSADASQVAAVDFQYVGGGCGMKDVAYFIGSCLYEEGCEDYEQALLDYYFEQLAKAVAKKAESGLEQRGTISFDDLEREWRSLYPVAWTDFHRFIKGWSPGHWKIHGYSERVAKHVIASLEKGEF